jgi:hypothetical protein
VSDAGDVSFLFLVNPNSIDLSPAHSRNEAANQSFSSVIVKHNASSRRPFIRAIFVGSGRLGMLKGKERRDGVEEAFMVWRVWSNIDNN